MATPKIPPDLAALSARVKRPEEGFFGPESITWRLIHERVLNAGGPASLLMQLAHPHVGQGVAEHSRFKQDPIGRTRRTFATVYEIVYGSVDVALSAAVRTRNIHAGVKGSLDVKAGKYKEGSRYHANRVDLLLWVHATLVDNAIRGYETFVGEINPKDKKDYYQESRLFARLFGVPEDKIPPTLGDFQAYMKHMVDNELAVTETALDLSRALLVGPPIFRVLAPANFLFAGGMLPPRIREQYRLPWNSAMQRGFDKLAGASRKYMRYVPAGARELLAHRRAMRRTTGSVTPFLHIEN